MLNVLNNDTWNEIKERHKSQLKASNFVLSAANYNRMVTQNLLSFQM